MCVYFFILLRIHSIHRLFFPKSVHVRFVSLPIIVSVAVAVAVAVHRLHLPKVKCDRVSCGGSMRSRYAITLTKNMNRLVIYFMTIGIYRFLRIMPQQYTIRKTECHDCIGI